MNYTLKNQSGVLGKVSLYKSSYKLGEDVTGTLDLSGASISCLQVRCSMYGVSVSSLSVKSSVLCCVIMLILFVQITALLQSIEEVSKECLKSSTMANSLPGLSSVSSTHARHSECCHNTLLSQFSLPIPSSVSQSFQTATGQAMVKGSNLGSLLTTFII